MPAIHGDSAHRTCRTKVFTGTAPYADLFADHRDTDAGLRSFYHADGPYRAVAGAVSALGAVFSYTKAAVYGSGTDMIRGFLFWSNLDDGPAGADIRAGSAFRAAVAIFVPHFRLHQVIQPGRRTENGIRADLDTELTGGAATVEILNAGGTRRSDGSFALQALFRQDFGESAIHLLILCFQRDSSQAEGRSGQECPSA